MKIIKCVYLIVAIFLTLTVNFFSAGYCSFDTLGNMESATVRTGTWSYLTTYFTDFENFYNSNNGHKTVNISGQYWNIYHITRGDNWYDNKIDCSSLHAEKNGYISSCSQFTGLKSISFYISLTDNAWGGHGYTFAMDYYVQVSSDKYNWTNIYTNQTNSTTLELIEIDTGLVLAEGLTLANGQTANYDTPLYIRIKFGSYSFDEYYWFEYGFNLDNLTIKYISIS